MQYVTLKRASLMVALFPFRQAVPLLITLVIVLFLFPLQVGSFQSTHGPTSTLKECLIGVLLQALVALLAQVLLSAGPRRVAGFVFLNAAPVFAPPGNFAISLRC
jgi:hypothetical protein